MAEQRGQVSSQLHFGVAEDWRLSRAIFSFKPLGCLLPVLGRTEEAPGGLSLSALPFGTH